MKAFVDVDDLWCREQIEKYLIPLKREVPELLLTAYSIPNKLGDVHTLRKEFPWIVFAQHGWEHTPFECRAWTADNAVEYLRMAAEMGYAPAFKPPNWTFDKELEEACRASGVVLHHHVRHEVSNPFGLRSYPGPAALRTKDHTYVHTHIQPNPATDSILTNPLFTPEKLSQFTGFLTPFQVAVGGL
jgi:hypothetical protein